MISSLKIGASLVFCTIATNAAAEVPLPSGQKVVLHEMLLDDTISGSDPVARFRYVAPEISRGTGSLHYADVEMDFQVLCRDHALITLENQGIIASQIVVSLSDRPTEFGQAAPDATQFFEAFRIEGSSCIWEPF